MDWDDLRHLLALARAGTLSGAARRLGVNQTTVARRLAALESALGARLFDRVDGEMRPTEPGGRLLVHAAEMEQQADAARRAVAQADAAACGSVRVTAVPILVNRLLVPRLAPLLAAHPGLTVDLAAEPGNLRLDRREADLALRLARPASGAMLARRLGRLDYAVYAPAGADPETLPWIGYASASAHLPPARWLDERGADRIRIRLNDAEAILQAVRSGLGRSLLPRFVGDADSDLAPAGGPALSREVWLLVPPEIRRQARIQAAIDWLEGLVHALPALATAGLPDPAVAS